MLRLPVCFCWALRLQIVINMEILLVNIIWFKLCAVYDALKELYYNSQHRWFIHRFHLRPVKNSAPLNDGILMPNEMTETTYCKYVRETHLPEWVQYPRHASVFGFFGAVYFCWRCERLDKSGYYQYCLVRYLDVAFINEAQTGEKL